MLYFTSDNRADVGDICYTLLLFPMPEMVEMLCLCPIIVYAISPNHTPHVRDVAEILPLK